MIGKQKSSFSAGLETQARCLEALMVRDMMMRYGRGNLGFLWVLVEPMILTTGVLFIWSIAAKGETHGVGIISLVLSGYMPLTLYRHMTNSSVFGLRRVGNLLYHRHVSLLDTFLSRMTLEFAGTSAALVIISSVLMVLGQLEPFEEPGLMAAAWLAMALYGFGSALVICVLTEYSEIWERFVGPYQYLMMPISGCFFMVDWLPTYAQDLIWFNPMTHCFEAFRAGMLGNRVVTHYDLWYPLLWGVGLFAFGLKMLDIVRDRIHFD